MKGKNTIAHIYPPEKPLKAQIKVHGSKSYTNRALIIASMAKGTSILYGCSDANDSLLLIKILQMLGVEIAVDKNTITIKGNEGNFKEFDGKINVEDAGTVMRFLTALCCIIPGEIIVEGSARMHKRPIKGLVDTLLQLGADITYLDEPGFPPVKIKGGMLHTKGKIEIDASLSSQFISALLIIAPVLDFDVEILSKGEISSAPYVDMTTNVMEHFGVSVGMQNEIIHISKNSEYIATDYTVEGDASSASYFFALAAITGSTIHVTNISPATLQGDVKFAGLLEQMGCSVSMGKDCIEVTGTKKLKSISADMKNMQDVTQTMAVVAAFAEGTTTLKGLKNLEIKETKRLTALQKELTRMGIKCQSDGEQITIHGGNSKGAIIQTYNDHRMAMAFAIAGTRVKDLYIESPGVVKKSFPGFWNTLKEIGVKIEIEEDRRNIVLIGFMGAGKTSVSMLLAKNMQYQLVETDDEIIHRSGYKSVNEIFEKKGESFFREMESMVILEYSKQSDYIISCGGGAIMKPANMEALKKNGRIIFLSASFDTIEERLKNEDSRPLFFDKEKAKELYTQRLPLYRAYADEIISTDTLTPGEAAELATSWITSNHAS